jgi:hypothetical protein
MSNLREVLNHFLPSILIFILMVGAISSCSKNKYSESDMISYVSFMNGLNEIQHVAQMVDQAPNKYPSCELNFDDYLSYFNELEVDSGWTVSYYYQYSGGGGEPVLYAHKKPDSSAASYIDSVRKGLRTNAIGYSDYYMLDSLQQHIGQENYMHPFHVNQSQMGYFQFTVFSLIGENFCLFWHANYKQRTIVVSKKQLNNIIEGADNNYYHFTESEKQNLQGLNLAPEILLNEDSAEIRIVTLSPWRGLIEWKYSITYGWPHKMYKLERNTLFEYDCGIIL